MKPSLAPPPDHRSDEAAKLVLRDFLDAMQAHESGVKAAEDPECLHDFRVALRRTRAVLRQIKGVFPENVTNRYLREFAELSAITSPARDLDIYLLEFEHYQTWLPEALRPSLEPLKSQIAERAAQSHQDLAIYLESAAYQDMMRSWRIFLAKPCPKAPSAPNALRPIQDIASRRILKLHRKMVEAGLAIAPEAPAKDLHELRKTGKKLRYLMECFRSLYEAREIEQPLKMLKRLQDHLGRFQDTHVQIENLGHSAAALRQNGVDADPLPAIGLLLDKLNRQERALRRDFPEHFADFARKRRFRRFLG